MIILITGCTAQKQIEVNKKPKIDETLPVLDHTKIRMIPDIKSVALEWVGTTKEDTNGYYIYRSEIQKDGKKMTRVATIKDRYARHYLDRGLKPQTQYIYSISVIGNNGSESRPSQSVSIKTLPLFESVSFIAAQDALPKKVRIVWRPHESYAVGSYIVEKTTPSQSKWKKIATINHRLNVEYIDKGLKDQEVYLYRVKAVTYDGIVSKPSMVVKATTKPLPKPPINIEATKDEPRKIIVRWDESPQEDKIAYNIYVSNYANGLFKKIKKAKKTDNTFVHIINSDNTKKFYKITTIDKDGLESDLKKQPAIEGKTLKAPAQPKLTLAQINTNKVILNWAKGDDRAVSYNIYKTIKRGIFDSETKVINNVRGLRFEDSDIIPGVEYKYAIEAVDRFNLVSAKTSSASLFMPKEDKKDK